MAENLEGQLRAAIEPKLGCDPKVHRVLMDAGGLLDQAWRSELIPLAISYDAWRRLEPHLRRFEGAYGLVRHWAVQSILISARRLTDEGPNFGNKANPVAVLRKIIKECPSLTLEQLLSHQECLRDEPLQDWIQAEHHKFLQRTGLFLPGGVLDPDAVQALIRVWRSAQAAVRGFVSRYVAHQPGTEEPVSSPSTEELLGFLEDVGSALNMLHLVVSYTGISNDVSHIHIERELVAALRVWDAEALNLAQREFLMSGRPRGDVFGALRVKYVVDEADGTPPVTEHLP